MIRTNMTPLIYVFFMELKKNACVKLQAFKIQKILLDYLIYWSIIVKGLINCAKINVFISEILQK